MTFKLGIYVILAIFLILIFCWGSYAQTSVDANGNNDEELFFDFEKGKVLLSIASLLGILALAWKAAIEYSINKAHRENQEIHGKVSDNKLNLLNLESLIDKTYIRKEDCSKIIGLNEQKIEKMNDLLEKNIEILHRIEEKMKGGN